MLVFYFCMENTIPDNEMSINIVPDFEMPDTQDEWIPHLFRSNTSYDAVNTSYGGIAILAKRGIHLASVFDKVDGKYPEYDLIFIRYLEYQIPARRMNTHIVFLSECGIPQVLCSVCRNEWTV